MSYTKLERLEQAIRFTRIGNRAIKRAQEESRRLNVPNVFLHNGVLLYEKQNGELTRDNLLHKIEPNQA